jgi:(p)ppGpp synthase/HD superfamily hydrolase
MNLVEEARAIAEAAHAGQVDKNGETYIQHPLRVAERVEGDIAKSVALLHDVVEDTDWTLDALRQRGFPEEVVKAVDALTRRKGETYEDFIRRCRTNPLARQVKFADIADNTDPSRPQVERLRQRYAAAIHILNFEDP